MKVLITSARLAQGQRPDVENGDLTPGDARQWTEAKERAAVRASTIYRSRSNVGAVREAFRGREYSLRVADWTDTPQPVKDTVATQYSNLNNAHDLSMAYSQEWLQAISKANRPWPYRT